MERDEILNICHTLGFTHKEIVYILARDYKIIVSERHLRRILKALGLYRRKYHSDIIEVAGFISRQLDVSGRQHGYRFMHLKCLLSGYKISRETVRVLLCFLDPEGVETRKKRRLIRRRYNSTGPNQVWHVDSYDKLSPYGIGINGCIDGFSRYIIWMEASYTNSDPKVIGGYFVNAILEANGCPRIIRCDMGTENTSIRRIQLQIRSDHSDERAGERSFVYGKSTANTRIESWWGILRKQNTEFWIEFFHKLQGHGHFCGLPLEKELVRFCFLPLIQSELDEFILMWNMHTIRRSSNETSPHERPFAMYHHPEVYGTTDQMKNVTEQSLVNCADAFCQKDELPCDEDIYDLCRYIMEERQLDSPNNAEAAKCLYLELRRVVMQLI